MDLKKEKKGQVKWSESEETSVRVGAVPNLREECERKEMREVSP